MAVTRRTLVNGSLGAGVAAVAAATAAHGSARTAAAPAALAAANAAADVVVIGGGMGGVSAAKFLRLYGGTGLSVTLVEPSAAYTSNIMSNLVLTGQRTISSLRYSYARLVSTYGVGVVQARALGLDPANKAVTLSTGARLTYKRLVVAPGLQFDPLPGLVATDYDTTFPHAWQGGPQTTLLRQQIVAMKPGGTFVMTIPLAPYRCPPGPYERACVVADWLKVNRPGSKVIVLDANAKIIAEPVAFTTAFTSIHAGTISYRPGVVIDHVDKAARRVYLSTGEAIAFDVFNPIPPSRAGAFAVDAGLCNVGGRWAGVNVLRHESTAVPGVHVLGDTIGTTMPKSGHMANAQGKVVADAIVRALAGQAPDPAPVTSSGCYSPITMSTASWLTGVFQYDAASSTMKAVSVVEAPSISSQNYNQMSKWFSGLMADTFA